jgi:hypothetical protein
MPRECNTQIRLRQANRSLHLKCGFRFHSFDGEGDEHYSRNVFFERLCIVFAIAGHFVRIRRRNLQDAHFGRANFAHFAAGAAGDLLRAFFGVSRGFSENHYFRLGYLGVEVLRLFRLQQNCLIDQFRGLPRDGGDLVDVGRANPERLFEAVTGGGPEIPSLLSRPEEEFFPRRTGVVETTEITI